MKNLLDYIIDNTKDSEYLASLEASLKDGKLDKKELKMSEIISFSNYLHSLNLSKDKKIGIIMDNCNEFVFNFA